MDKIVIKGAGPSLDGEYEFDASRLTTGDLHIIKQISGVRAGELKEALAAGDSDVVVAMVVIALERNGKTVSVADLWAVEPESFEFVVGEREADVVPPVLTPGGLHESELVST